MPRVAKIAIPCWGQLGTYSRFALVCFRTSFNWDHLVTDRDGKAWMLVEAKRRMNRSAPHWRLFKKQTSAQCAFQVVLDDLYLGDDWLAKPLHTDAREYRLVLWRCRQGHPSCDCSRPVLKSPARSSCLRGPLAASGYIDDAQALLLRLPCRRPARRRLIPALLSRTGLGACRRTP